MQNARTITMMGGKRLPYDSETEYLQATGPQWIDTGLAPTASMKIEARWKQMEASTTQQRLYGVRENGVYYDIFIKNGKWQGRFFSTKSVATATVAAGEVYALVADAATGTITVNGVTASTGATPATTFTGTIPIFARRVDGTVSTSYESKMQLYSLRIYESGVLVRDFISVRKGTTGYLYDRVSGALFGNAGTGDFGVGPDKN